MVVLCLQLLQEVKSPVAQALIAQMTPIGEKHRHSRVDKQQVTREGRDMFLVFRALTAKHVMGLPVGRDTGSEDFLKLLQRLTLHQSAQAGTT